MKVIEQTPIRLTLRAYPWSAWIVGSIWLAIGLYFLFVIFIGAIALFIGLLYLLLVAQIETCYIDKILGLVILTEYGLCGKKVREYAIGAIGTVEVEQYKTRSKGHTRVGYRTVIVLKRGDRVPVTVRYKSCSKSQQKIADRIRAFIHL